MRRPGRFGAIALVVVLSAAGCGRSFDRDDQGDAPPNLRDQGGDAPVDQGPRCAIDNGGCADEATCSEETGSVVCTCPEGTIGDGRRCDPGARIALLSERPGEWFFGAQHALSRDGRTLVVANSAERSPGRGVDAVPGAGTEPSGAIYVYRREDGGWAQDAFIKAFNADPGDRFGSAIAVSDDGTTIAVAAVDERSTGRGVGAVDNDDGRGEGAVYVYARGPGGWALDAYVKAETDEITGQFGRAIALSGDGSTLVVQSRSFSEPRPLSTYERRDGEWVFLAATDGSGVAASRLWMSPDATLLACTDSLSPGIDGDVGGTFSGSELALNAGTVALHEREGDLWTQSTRFNGPTPEAGDALFGGAFSTDGTVLVAGASGEDGSQGGIDPAHDNELADSGAAYVFRRTGERWAVDAVLKAPEPAFRMGMALTAVSGDGRLVAVGAARESSAGGGIRTQASGRREASGAVFLFRFDGDSWAQTAIVKAPVPSRDARFGGSLSLSADGSLLVVAATLENDERGALYLYELEIDR